MLLKVTPDCSHRSLSLLPAPKAHQLRAEPGPWALQRGHEGEEILRVLQSRVLPRGAPSRRGRGGVGGRPLTPLTFMFPTPSLAGGASPGVTQLISSCRQGLVGFWNCRKGQLRLFFHAEQAGPASSLGQVCRGQRARARTQGVCPPKLHPVWQFGFSVGQAHLAKPSKLTDGHGRPCERASEQIPGINLAISLHLSAGPGVMGNEQMRRIIPDIHLVFIGIRHYPSPKPKDLGDIN